MKSLALFILWAAVAHAVPVTNRDPDRCAQYCSGYSKYKYSPGTTYVFDYSATTTTEVKGAGEQSAKLKLAATAEIDVYSTCEFGLRLSGVQLSHTDGTGRMKSSEREASFKQSVEKSVLRFSFDDGVVHHICPTTSDPAWVLNIKRGVLSVFQNGMFDWNKDENRTETDLAGICKTKYIAYSPGYFTSVVRREKDMLTCTQRNNLQAIYHMVGYNVQSDWQSFPIMKTTHVCDHSIKTKGFLSWATCKEMHIYRPFSNGENGGSTTIYQALTYNGERRGIKTRQTAISTRSNLLFEHITTIPDPSKAMEMVERNLVELCITTKNDIRPETPNKFSELVANVRFLNYMNMETLYRKLKTKGICPQNTKGMKFFMDALPMAPTAASIRMMSTLISGNEVQGLKTRAWLTSLALIHKPTLDMLREAMALLYNAKIRKDAMLPVSSMVYSFCKNRGTSGDCANIPEIDAIITSMMKDYLKFCDTRRDLGGALLLLRSLGNTGYPTKTVDAINTCMTSRYNGLEVKVAAAQAFRRMPCNADNSMLWTTLSDTALDSELRIAAYLSLMRCPDDNLQRLVTILNNEQAGHVGSFIYSHITNLQESSNPHNQALAEAISRLTIDKEFANNPMETSTNWEKSVMINKLNTGFTSDTNIIWSDKSKNIHSISSNLSVELFGNSINVLDVGARLDGLKYLARSIVYGSKTNPEAKEQFQLSMYGRVFGNEVMFQHHKLNAIPFPFEESDKWMDRLIKLADVNEFTYTQSLQFMNSGVVVPTAAGLPLSLRVNGSAVMDIIVSGKLDVRKLAAKPRSLTVDGEINPSAAIEMNSIMAIDAYGMAQIGLRMKNVMHTSTAIKGRIHLDRGQQFSMDVDLPRDKIEIFEAKSEFLLQHNKEEKSLKMITDNRKEVKFSTGEMLSKATGMELVAEASYPNASMQSDGPYFPMTGPASFKVVLNKKDTQTGFKIFVKRIEKAKSTIAQILLNTPGSRTDRKMLVDLTMDYPKKELEIKAISPWKKATFKGSMVDTESRKALSGNLLVDDTSSYGLMSEVQITDSKTSTTLVPKLEIRRPGKTAIVLSGIVNYETAYNGIDSAFTLSGIRKEPYLLNGKVTNTLKEKSLSLSFTPPDSKKDYAFETKNMFTDLGNQGVSINSQLNVRTPIRSLASAGLILDHRTSKMLKVDGKIEVYRILRKSSMAVSIGQVTRNGITRFNHDSKIKSPRLTGRIQGYTSVKGFKHAASKFTLDYTIPRKYQNKVLMDLKYNDRSTKAYTKYDMKSIVNFRDTPKYNMGLEATVDFKKRVASSTVEIKYGPNMKDKNKSIILSSSLKKNVRNWKNANVEYKLKAQAPEFNVDMMLDGNHAHSPKTLDSTLQLDYASGKTLKMGVNLKDQSTKKKKFNGVTFLSLPSNEYTLSSSLIESSPTEMTHAMLLVDKRGTNYQMSTVVNTQKNKPRTFVSNIKLDGMKPMSVSGSANLDPKNFIVNGELKYAKDSYLMSTSGKFAPNTNRGKLAFELQYPSRKITMAVDGGLDSVDKINYQGNMDIDWDANRKKSKSQMSVAFNHLLKMSDDAKSLSTMFLVKTPFKKFENIGSSFKYLSDAKQSDITAKVTPGSKSNEISTTLNTVYPFNIYNAVATMTAKSPFRGLKQVEVNINHKLDSTLSSVVKGILEQYAAELIFTGENKGDNYRTDLKGNMALKSNIPNFKFVNLAVSHNGDSKKYMTSSALTHNGDKYTCDMNMDHSKRGWNIQNKGDITIATPKRRFSTIWNHKNSDKNIDSSLASSWDNKVFDLKLNGLMKDGPMKTLDTSVLVQSPWDIVRDANLKFNGKYGNGVLNSKVAWHRNSKIEMSSEINYVKRGSTISLDTKLASPFHEDITGKMSVDYQRYPMTGTTMVQWSPKSQLTMTGSALIKTWDNTDFDLKVTTPFSLYRNVVWKASSKKDNKENVLLTNIDTGVRRWMNVETRFRMDDAVKMAKFKLKSSHVDLKSVDTGFRLEGDVPSVFNVNVEFEAEPHIDKMSAMFVLKNQDKFTSNLYIFTPFPVMPSLEASLTYEKAASQHVTRLQIECPTKITGAIEMSVKTDFPINVNTKITSDNPRYNNIGFSLQHDHTNRKINSHAEVIYKPGQKIEADAIGSWAVKSERYSLFTFVVHKAEGSVMVKTPFKDYRLSKIALKHKIDGGSIDSHIEYSVGKHHMGIDGSVQTGSTSSGTFAIISSIPGAEKVRWTFKNQFAPGNIKLESLWMRNKEQASVLIMNKYMQNSLESSVVLTSSFMQTVKVELNHKYSPDYNFVEKVTVSYGQSFNFDGEASSSVTGNVITGNTMIKYKQGKIREAVGLSISKTGEMNDFNINAIGTRNSDVVNVKGTWKHGNDIAANIGVTTPFENYKKLNMKLSHKGSIHDFKTESSVTYMDDKTISGKLEFAHGNGKIINVVSEIHTPESDVSFKVIHNNNFFDNRAPKTEFKGLVELTTSVERFRYSKLTYQAVGVIDNFVADVAVVRNRDQIINFKAVTNSLPTERSFKTTMDITGSMIKDTTLMFEKIGNPENLLNPRYSGTVKMSVLGRMDQKTVAVYTEVTKRGTISRGMFETSVEVVTPIQDFETTKFNYKHKGESTGFTCHSTLEYSNSKIIEYDLQAMSNPTPKYVISVKTPYTNYKDMKYEIVYDIKGPVYSLTSNVNAGNGYVFSLTGNLDIRRDIKGSVFLTTPFKDYNDLSVTLSHQGNIYNINSGFTVVYMNSKSINGKIRFNRDRQWNSIDLNTELKTPFKDMLKTIVLINHKHDSRKANPQVTSSGSIEYGSGQKFEGVMQMSYDPDFDLKLDIKSPFRDYRSVKIVSKAENPSFKSFKGMGSVIFNRVDTYASNINWNVNTWKYFNGFVNLFTSKMGKNQITYSHNINSQKIDALALIEYNRDKKIKAEVKTTLNPGKKLNVMIKTPFDGFEDTNLALMYSDSNKKYATENGLDLGKGRVYIFKSALDYSSSLMSFTTNVKTPIPELKSMDLKMTHEGPMKDFTTYVYFNLPQTDVVEGKTTVTYNGVFDASLSTSLQSSMTNMNDMKLDVKTSELAGEKKMTTALQWAEGKVIMSNVLYRRQSSGRNDNKYHADFTLTTPFSQVQSMSLNFDQAIKTKAYETKVMAQMNGDQLCDVDLSLGHENDEPRMEMTVRQPRSLQLRAKTSLQDIKKEAEVYANWDRADENSNINIKVSRSLTTSEQGFILDVRHPSRTVGLTHKVLSARGMNTYEGKMYWNTDDDSRLTYTLEMKDSDSGGRRRPSSRTLKEGMVKLALPGRTLSLVGIYSGQGISHNIDTTFSWDVGKDPSKLMKVKASLYGTTPKKGDIIISLPTMNKEMKLEGEFTMNSGRTILDARTDFSYSKDARKTLTLTSKIEDIKNTQSGFNYSLTVGVAHPYTQVDVQMTSHISQSEEKACLGAKTMYLTARKQMKNMALFAEIDKIKKTLNVQMTDPMHQMVMSGKVVSEIPYKFLMENKLDDKTFMKWDVTMDSNRKAVLFNTYYNNDERMSVSAMYPNSTSIKADITKYTPMLQNREMVIGLNLWSPRLLHTSLQWRPGMMKDMSEYTLKTFRVRSDEMLTKWKNVNMEIIDELSYKYAAIVNAVSEEARPFLEDVNRELVESELQIQKILRNLDQFYRNYAIYDKMGEIGQDVYVELRSTIAQFGRDYKNFFTKFMRTSFEKLDEWKSYDLKRAYTYSLEERHEQYKYSIYRMAEDWEDYMDNIDSKIEELEEARNEIIGRVRNNPFVKEISNRIDQIQRIDMDVTPYIPDVISYPSRMARWTMDRMPNVDLTPLTNRPVIKFVHTGANEVYQQGMWAYRYWQVEKSIKERTKTLLRHLKLIAQDELKEHMKIFHSYSKSPIAVWLPKRGSMEMDIPLPLPVDRLDQLPDWSPYFENMDFTMMKDAKEYVVETFSSLVPSYLSSPNTTGMRLIPETNRRVNIPPPPPDSNRRYSSYNRRRGGGRRPYTNRRRVRQ